MDPEKLQQAWQSQPGGSQIHVDADALIKEVRRKQQSFRATILWRDFREILAAFCVMVAVSLDVVFKGIQKNWPWLFLVVGAAWVVGYLLFDRWRQRPNAPRYEGALSSHVEQSLKDVEHQIWLLRNVFWWYLLPLALGCLIPNLYFLAKDLGTRELQAILVPFVRNTGILLAIFYGAYLLNQYAVRSGLEPRRRELLAIRESLLNTEE